MVCHIFSEKYDQEFSFGHIGGVLARLMPSKVIWFLKRFSTHSWCCEFGWTVIHPVDVKQHKLFIHWSQWHCQNLGHSEIDKILVTVTLLSK